MNIQIVSESSDLQIQDYVFGLHGRCFTTIVPLHVKTDHSLSDIMWLSFVVDFLISRLRDLPRNSSEEQPSIPPALPHRRSQPRAKDYFFKPRPSKILDTTSRPIHPLPADSHNHDTMARGPLSAGAPPKKEKKAKGEKRVKKAPHPDNVAPDRRNFGTKSSTHAKWPAMFKRHLGVIETHIRTIDRVMQSMKANIDGMEEGERKLWESGEKGMWVISCGMMQRAQAILKDAREAAAGVVRFPFISPCFSGWLVWMRL